MDLFNVLGNFVRVADSGSFSRVAREVGLTQTAISRQVAYLEQHFGVRLLHRTTRQVSLTGDGEILLGHARRLLEESSAMERDLGAHRDTPVGLVRIACITGAGLSLAARLPQLLNRHPDLSVELVVCDHVNEMVESRIDLALCNGRIADSSFIARQIGAFRYSLVAAPCYVEQYGAPKAPEDLDGYTCIMQATDGRCEDWALNGPDGSVVVRVSGQLFTKNERAALVMVCSGYGIACLPDAQVRDDIHAGRLIRLLPQYAPKLAMLYAVYPSRRHLASRTRAVLDFLIQQGRAGQDAADWQLPEPRLSRDVMAMAPVRLAAVGQSRAAVMS
jgi:DNA-binding transcriptional LysR family regulator